MPSWLWLLLILSPIDLLPDWVLGPIGFLDDLFYLVMFFASLGKDDETPALPPKE